MKNIFTIAAALCLTFATANAQSTIRLIDNGMDQVEVQIKLGAGVGVYPGPGADFCNVDVNTDSLIQDITFTVGYDPADISSIAINNVICDNNFYCACDSAFGPPFNFCVAGLNPTVPGGERYGSQEVNTGTAGNINWHTFASFDAPCNDEGWYNAPVKWMPEVYYTVAILDVTLAPTPPGSEPLALTDMISLDDGGVWNPDLPINITVGNFNIGLQDVPPAVDDTPTPLTLISFDAIKEGDRSAKLSWTTANEINTKMFVVQRSLDREMWNDIGGVEAAVNSAGILEYAFLDKNVFDGRSERQMYYYRLKMVDQDDQFEYSNIDVVSFNTFGDNVNDFDLFVFPNPAKDGVNVEINQVDDDNPITRLELFDITGKIVYSRDFDEGSLLEYVDFSRHNITAGTYILKASDAAGALKANEKIVVTR